MEPDTTSSTEGIPEEYLDGCTGFFDTVGGHDIEPCCTAHDIAYWHATDILQKFSADIELGMCVMDTGGDVLSALTAIVMVSATGIFGTYFWATKKSRWGESDVDSSNRSDK
tara:strand:+ start:366 stop:701 length:336 start_codon:yes stop_codon:yes gene_type:complete